MALLLIVQDVNGGVHALPLSHAHRLGGGGLDLPGLSGAVVSIEPVGATGEPRLNTIGHATVLVNGEPPAHDRRLETGDELIVGSVLGRVATAPDLIVEEADRAPRPAAAEDESVPSGVLGGVTALLGSSEDDDAVLSRLLEQTRAAVGADRVAVISCGISGDPLVRAASPADQGPLLVLPRGALALEAPAATPLDDGGRLVLTAPIRGRRSGSSILVAETSDPLEGALPALALLATAAGVALERTWSDRRAAASGRLATIGRAMAGVAHDLKNLMTGLRTGVFYLDDALSEHEEPRLREAWSILKNAQETIEALVTDMVSYGKPVSLEPVTGDLASTVRKAVELTKNRARDKGVAVESDLPETPGVVFDAAAIERCVLNLVINALDAAPPTTGHVRVALRTEGGAAVLTVEDDGAGIPVEDRQRVFDLLYSTKGARGTGFGLAIVRQVVEAHGGTAAAEGDPDGGARLVVRLPRAGGRRSAETARGPS